jgi:16S rRNA (guanine966-N2)-methyltransferase
MVRIISGYFKGQLLKTNQSPRLRPTRDRVKETLFSVLGDIENRRVADLYAGSGNLGLEALSRGARSCVFVEKDPRQIRIIHENSAKLKLENDVDIRKMDAIRFLSNAVEYDLILADPPYQYRHFNRLFGAFERLQPDTRIVLESGKDLEIPTNLSTKITAQKVIGETKLTFMRI